MIFVCQTPDSGIFFDTDSALDATPKLGPSNEDMPKLRWFRTMIPVDKGLQHVWALDSLGTVISSELLGPKC